MRIGYHHGILTSRTFFMPPDSRLLPRRLPRYVPAACAAVLACLCMPAHALDLTLRGFGNLNGATAFDEKAIAEALPPGYTVKPGKAGAAGAERVVYQVMEKGKRVITVDGNDGKVSGLAVESGSIAAPGGARVGASFSYVFPKAKAQCKPGQGEDSGTVICTGAQPAVRYQFAGKPAAPDGEMPGPKVLSKWRLRRILWAPQP
jgi:hypothetical protein